MTEQDRQELCMKAAGRVHAAWCEGELKGFYNRFIDAYKEDVTPGQALHEACLKNGKPRNEIDLDTTWLMFHEVTTHNRLKSFEGFKELFNKGVIAVKRFTARELTEEEKKNAVFGNYKEETGEENILRPFEELSAASQKENLDAAKGAVAVLEEYFKRGFTVEQLMSKEMEAEIGTLIHADWMKRNKPTENNRYMFVAFDKLDDWTKQQDLDVFFAMLEEYSMEPKKYEVPREEGLEPLDIAKAEKEALDAVAEKDMER